MGEGRGVIFLLCMKDGLLSMAVKQLIFLFCLWGGGGYSLYVVVIGTRVGINNRFF